MTTTLRRVPAAWQRDADGGLCIDRHMRVIGASGEVFCAGDAASASDWNEPHWHQMRLWSQARQMGTFAGLCMVAPSADAEPDVDASLELFTHTTRFFGMRVVLLGRYNGQGLDAGECVSYSRSTTPGADGSGSFVRLLLAHGRLRGAVLIGEEACDLCEMYENLILDGVDLSSYGADLIDLDEDYFD